MDAKSLTWTRLGVSPDRVRAKSFEAQLMDWCDDVTYAVHDLLDFYRGGFVPLERIFSPGRRLRSHPGTRLPNRFTVELIQLSAKEHDYPVSDVEEAWRCLVPLVEIFAPWSPGRSTRALTQRVTSQLITHFVEGVTWEGSAPLLHQGNLRLHASNDEAHIRRVASNFLKSLLWEFVINKPEFLVQQEGQAKIVRSLLDIYAGNVEILPADRKEDLEEHGDSLRAATDHVASLTEQDAHALYERLTGYRLGSLTDVLAT